MEEKEEGLSPGINSNAVAYLPGYNEFLTNLKERVRASHVKAALSVNRELVLLYWQIGSDILERQRAQGWGAKVVDKIAADLRHEFPEMRGFSTRNLKYMRLLAETYADFAFVQQPVAQMPWVHNVILMNKVKNPTERE